MAARSAPVSARVIQLEEGVDNGEPFRMRFPAERGSGCVGQAGNQELTEVMAEALRTAVTVTTVINPTPSPDRGSAATLARRPRIVSRVSYPESSPLRAGAVTVSRARRSCSVLSDGT